MTDNTLASALRPATRFLRSTDLVRDFEDPSALTGYYLTEFGKQCFARITEGLSAGSSARAWRLTGDYGSGKSSFALLLAASLAEGRRLPPRLQAEIGAVQPHARQARYVPLLVTGSREAMAVAIVRGLHDLHQKHFARAKSGLDDRLKRYSQSDGPIADHVVVQLVQEVTAKLIEHKIGRGLLLVLDEVGKFLEYAALYPDKQDVFLLQKLGEYASRSGEEPFLLVCLLHQGFNAYADALATGTKREWEKVAGRLEEIQFQQPLDQVVLLMASALNGDASRFDEKQLKGFRQSMDIAIQLGWFGATSSRATLRQQAAGLYPIDPFVVPVLVRLFQRYGQNERSVFNFLFSYEPMGLTAFASCELKTAVPFRLHHFYDYVRVNLGQRLSVASYRSHWVVIESVIDSFPAEDEMELQVMKTVGMLNLLNNDDLVPTEPALQWAVAGAKEDGHKAVSRALRRLRAAKLVFYRGEGRGFCLWPHSSVDIEARYDEAKREIPHVGSWAKAISGLLDTSPLVARRHYIATGNLRFLRVVYCAVADLSKHAAAEPVDADGAIIVPLCENDQEHRTALKLAPPASAATRAEFIRLIAVPRSLDRLAGIILDSLRWDWVVTHTPQLNNDQYARDEVSRFRADALNRLERAVQDFVGLNRTSSRLQLAWFHRSERVRLDTGRDLLSFISNCCDDAFAKAPAIHNELVNRRALSSAAAAARMRLIELMFLHADKPDLGIPAGKNPPEKSMYLSVLKNTGLHREVGPGHWELGEPRASDPCRVRSALQEIRDLLEKHADQRYSVNALMAHLRRPPFGLRDGIIPLLLAVVAIADKRDVAVYENGTFLRDVGRDAFLRLSKNPERFDIQYCKIDGARAELFQQLVGLLKLRDRAAKKPELLDLVRDLCKLVADLPEYARNTKKLGKRALAVRTAILEAQEPVVLVFHQLPVACGFAKFGPSSAPTAREAESFANALRDAIEEIRGAYPALETRVLRALAQSFDFGHKNFATMRLELAERAEAIAVLASDIKLKGLALRLMDPALPQEQWVDSVGSFLGLRPPTKWKDEDEDVFSRELALLSGRFKRAEAVVFATPGQKIGARALRIALTKADGSERQQVLFVSPGEEKALHLLKVEIARLVAQNPHVGLAAASQVVWEELKEITE